MHTLNIRSQEIMAANVFYRVVQLHRCLIKIHPAEMSIGLDKTPKFADAYFVKWVYILERGFVRVPVGRW